MTTARDRPPEEASEDTSFARGLRVLLMVADRGGIRADELSELLDTPLSTVYRYLRTLAEFGFVDRRGSEYWLGPRLLIGGANVTSATLLQAAAPVMQVLVEETGETALLLRRVGITAVTLAAAEPSKPLRVTIETGTVFPLHTGAGPRALLAFAPPEVVDEVLAAAAASPAGVSIDEAELRASLADIVTTGLARSEGEIVPGTVSIAVPVLREDGIAAAIAVVGPEFRCSLAWRTRVARLLPEAAQTVVKVIGRGGAGA